MIEYEIWDAEAFQPIAVFQDERSATEWVYDTFADEDASAAVDRFSLIASSDDSDNVIASGHALIDYAIQQHNLAGIS